MSGECNICGGMHAEMSCPNLATSLEAAATVASGEPITEDVAMRMQDVQPGMKVRFHPVIGGRHDGNIYTVTPAGAVELPGAGQVCWLAEKCGCVAIAALSPVCGNAELQQMDLSGGRP